MLTLALYVLTEETKSSTSWSIIYEMMSLSELLKRLLWASVRHVPIIYLLCSMEGEIKRHQEVQALQGEVQEVFINEFQRWYNADRTIQVLKSMFDAREEEQKDKEFWEKYNATVDNSIDFTW